MYRKTNSRKTYDRQTTYGGGSRPTTEGSVKDLISQKAMRDLPKSSYSIKADPYTAALPTSEPYPLLAKFNRVADASYSGEDNIDGGNVQQYANSTTSAFLKYFDSFRLKYNVNYRYLPITTKTTVGKSLVDEQRKSIAEAVSVLKATTFTQMAINNFAVETDLAMGSAQPKQIGTRKQMVGGQEQDVPIMAYTDLTDVIYAMSIYYQIFLQDSLSVMNWHNSFRLKQGTAIRDAWNREVPNLNSFFGLMNKKAFLSLLESINLSFEGEYVDKDFMTQMNILCLMPSRRSNSITDPVLELQIGWEHPKTFRLFLLDDKGLADDTKVFFDDANLKLTIPVAGSAKSVTYWEACDNLRDYLSLEATKLWARSSYSPASITGTDNARYNQIKAYFDVITACFVMFKPLWADYRETLDVMTRTGTLNWSKGFRPSIVKDTDAGLFYNLIVDDIYNMALSGPDVINYDPATKRWRTYSKWNMYTGIPAYDTKAGGSFLSFSFKSDMPTGKDDTEQIEYLPILFSYNADQLNCVGVSRDGYECAITTGAVKMSETHVLSRLAPLASQKDLTIRVPTFDSSDNVDLMDSNEHISTLYKTLTQMFGMCRIETSNASGISYDYSLDPDILAIYQEEVSDITNLAITYARANAPFRGTTSSADLLGFKNVK